MTHHNDTSTFRFTYYRLDACWVASELADLVVALGAEVPRGHHQLVDQVVRSATALGPLIAEGANRFSAKQRRCASEGVRVIRGSWTAACA